MRGILYKKAIFLTYYHVLLSIKDLWVPRASPAPPAAPDRRATRARQGLTGYQGGTGSQGQKEYRDRREGKKMFIYN